MYSMPFNQNPLGLYEPFTEAQLKKIKLSEMRFTGATYNSTPWFSLAPRDFNYKSVDTCENSIVMSCINWITRNFPQADLSVARTFKNNRPQNIDVEHPMLQLIANPNGWYDADTLWAGTLLSYNLDGNAYWLEVRSGRGFGKPSELWYVPHWQIEPHWPQGKATTDYIDYYIYTVNGEEFKLDVENVIHFRNGLDPNNQRKGLSPLKSVLLEVFTDYQASRYTAALLKNMAVPGVAIIPKDGTTIDQTKADAIKQTWKSKFGGDNVGEPFIGAAPVEITTIGFTPEQMNFEKLRMIPEARVSGALGIPMIIAGLTGGVSSMTKNDFEHAETYAFEQNLVPTWRSMSKVLNRQLLPDFEARSQVQCFFDTSYVKALKENENEKQERGRAALSAGAITINEMRELAGFKALPKEQGDVFLIPGTSHPTTAERLAEDASKEPEPAPVFGQTPKEGMPPQPKSLKIYDYNGLMCGRKPTPLEEKIDIKAIASEMDAGKNTLVRLLTEVRDRIITESARALGKMKPSDFNELSLSAEKAETKKLRQIVGELVAKGRALIDKELKAQGVTVKAWISGATYLGEKPSGGVDVWMPANGNGTKQLEGDDELDDLTDATLSRIINDVQARAIAEALGLTILGVGASELTKRVIQALNDGSTAYVDRAAAGTANAAIGRGRMAEAEARRDEWDHAIFSSVLDQNTCAPCADEDGSTYKSLDDAPMTPYDECEGDSNCRCVIVVVAADEV